MSLQYSDTTNKNGILQRIEQELGFPDGYITGDTTRLAQWTGSVNLGLDKAFHTIFGADGRWQFDDSNYTNYPILTGDMVSGQRDYSFTADSSGNLILKIARVFVKTSSTNPYYEIYSVDTESDVDIGGLANGLDVPGYPYQYDKTATGIFLDPLPSVTVTNGIKLYVAREGVYFTTSSTTQKPGFAGLYHEYLVLEPAYRYARANNLANVEVLKRDILELEQAIVDFYSRRDQTESPILNPDYVTGQ